MAQLVFDGAANPGRYSAVISGGRDAHLLEQISHELRRRFPDQPERKTPGGNPTRVRDRI